MNRTALSYEEFRERIPFRDDHDYLTETVDYEYQNDYKRRGKSYEEVEGIFHAMTKDSKKSIQEWQYFFYKWLIDYQYVKYKKQNQVSLADECKSLMKNDTKLKYMFITVGWDDSKITIPDMVKLSSKIGNLAIFKNCSVSYVLEKHRHSGIHHHTHFLLTTPNTIGFGAIFQKLEQISGLYKFTKKNFIDIDQSWVSKGKPIAPLKDLTNYINGIKQHSKMEFVQQDDEWRAAEKLEKIYIIR